MATPEAEKRRKAIIKKSNALRERLIKEFPEFYKQAKDFFGEIAEIWIKMSPFVGEEDAYGASMISISEEQEIRNAPIDFIMWTTLFKIISDKFDEELKWFRENKKILQMMVKEYLAAEKLR